MELQFHKTPCPCMQQVKWDVQSQEQTQEVRLPDSMPDIGSVLGAWGQVLIRGKEWHSGGMQVSGGMMAWVLYMPEEGGLPQCVEAWIPFQLRWDLPDTQCDGRILVSCLLRSVDARSTGARKLMVRATVSALGQALVPGEAELYSPKDVPEDICLLEKTYPVRLPREAGEKAFTLEEELNLPASCPPIGKLMRYCLQPELTDKKVMTDKVVFRGAALLHILYRTDEGSLCTWDFELPFSQYAELDGAYDQDATGTIVPAVTSLELDVDPEGRLRLKAGLTGQYVVYDCPVLRIVEDACSPRREVTVRTQQLQLPMVLEEHAQTVRAEQAVHTDGSKIADIAFYPDHARVLRTGGGVELTLPGQFQLLCYDDAGALQSTAARWEGTWSLSAGEDSDVQALTAPSGFPQGTVTAGEGMLRGDVLVDAMTVCRTGLPMVTALEFGEAAQPDPNRPSLILQRAGERDLWSVAKACGSTVEAIQQANGLAGEPAPQQMLLIPVL